jgi:hypothetical protein
MKTFVAKLLMKAGVAALLVTAAAGAVFAQSDTKAAKKDFEVIESAGLSVPNPLTPQNIESFVDENIVTTQAGRLLVTKSIDLSATCTPTSGVLYYLMVDDAPIRSSAVFSRTGVTGQLTGVSADVVAPGPHRIRIGQQCTVPGATVSGGTVTLVGLTSIIVLP